MATPLVNTHRIGDFVKWEVRREYSRQQVSLTAPAGGLDIPNPMGYPAVDNGDGTITLALVATEGDVNCAILIDKPLVMAALEVRTEIAILRYGPAIVNSAILPADDYAAAAFTAGALEAALLAEGIHSIAEAPQIEEQVT